MVSWSDLQTDLLWKIVHDHSLHKAMDTIRLRSVCRSWRNSLPAVVAPSEHLRLPAEGAKAKTVALIENTVWSLQSTSYSPDRKSSGCLILFNVTGNGTRRISHPILQEIGPMLQVSPNPWVLNFLHVRAYERYRFYIISEMKSEDGRLEPCLSKALVFPSSIWSKPNDLAVLALPIGGRSGNLRFWKYGDRCWTVVEGSENLKFQDIVIFEDQFVAVDATGAVFSINPATGQAEEVGPPVPPQPERTFIQHLDRRLVVSGLDLYLVKTRNQLDYQVQKLKHKRGKKCWGFVNDLGSKALFWGRCSSFFIEAQDCSDCRANCIYYHDKSRDTIREFDLRQRVSPKDLVFSNIVREQLQLQSSELMKLSIATYPTSDVFRTGFGGLLRDSDGRIRAMFSGKLEAVSPVRSEMGKLLEMINFAMGVFYKGGWSEKKKKLQLEFSCSKTLGLMLPLLPLICPVEDYVMRQIGEVVYSCVGRLVNADAVEIAKKGLDRSSIFQAWD